MSTYRRQSDFEPACLHYQMVQNGKIKYGT